MGRRENSGPESLSAIRGELTEARANARSVAALVGNPGCVRRRVIDAARVRSFELAQRLGHPTTRGQSPFAIATGNQFEKMLKQGSGYRHLAEVLRLFVDIPDPPNVVDLGAAKGHRPGEAALRARAAETERILEAIAHGRRPMPHIVDHPVLIFDVAGTPVFLEPDALAFRRGRQLQLVEIKSYPVIDGQADPSKLAATTGQVAVYFLAVRATLERLGLDPAIMRESFILVAPRNFGRSATAHEIPLGKKVRALDRVLRAVPGTADLLTNLALPPGYTFDVSGCGTEPRMNRELNRTVRMLPMQYVPECLSSCDMAKYCRHQAIEEDHPSRLGRDARNSLAGVEKLADVLRLATQGAAARDGDLNDVAEALGKAYEALSRARSRAGMQNGSVRRRSAGR